MKNNIFILNKVRLVRLSLLIVILIYSYGRNNLITQYVGRGDVSHLQVCQYCYCILSVKLEILNRVFKENLLKRVTFISGISIISNRK